VAFPSPGSRVLYLLLASAVLGGCAWIPCGWIYPRAEELARRGIGSEGFRLPPLGVLVSGEELLVEGRCVPATEEEFEVIVEGKPHPVRILPFHHLRIFVPLRPYPGDRELVVKRKGCDRENCNLLKVRTATLKSPDLSLLPPFRFRQRFDGRELPSRLKDLSFTGGKKIGRDPELKSDRIELWVYEGQGEGGDPIFLYLLTPRDTGDPTPWVPVLYIHGYRSCKETVFAFADVASRFGIALFAFDLMGHGERALAGLPYECGKTLPWELLLEGDLSRFLLALKEGAEVAKTLIFQIQRGDFPGIAKERPLGVLGHSLGGEALFYLMADRTPGIQAYGFTASGIGYAGMLPFFLDPGDDRRYLSLLPGDLFGEMANEIARSEPASLLGIPPLPQGYIFAQVMVSDAVLSPMGYEALVHTLSGRSGFFLYDSIPAGHLAIFFPGSRGIENRLIQWQIFQFFRKALLGDGKEPIEILPWDDPRSVSEVTALYGAGYAP
jgi:pimeloyl-ACP methyl ester carboxylesterase